MNLESVTLYNSLLNDELSKTHPHLLISPVRLLLSFIIFVIRVKKLRPEFVCYAHKSFGKPQTSPALATETTN